MEWAVPMIDIQLNTEEDMPGCQHMSIFFLLSCQHIFMYITYDPTNIILLIGNLFFWDMMTFFFWN